MTLEVFGVPGLPEVVPGDDLAALIATAADLRDGDVVVVAQKVVSKAEGALVALAPGEDAAAARRRLAVAGARRVVVDAPFTVVVETQHGLVCANGGIDASNVPEGHLLLLPVDPDASARRLRDGLRERTGATVAVVVSDTFGRAWRMGQTDVAIGAAGIAAIRDERGTIDREGRVLDVTESAIADELAGAADLVRTKGDGVPVVIVRGLAHDPDAPAAAAGAAALIRPSAQDLFRRGRGTLADELAQPWPQRATGRPPAAALARAVAAGAAAVAGGAPVGAEATTAERCELRVLDRGDAEEDAPDRLLVLPAGELADDVRAAALAGAAAGVVLAALADLDLVGVLRPATAAEAGRDRPGALVVEAGRHAEEPDSRDRR